MLIMDHSRLLFSVIAQRFLTHPSFSATPPFFHLFQCTHPNCNVTCSSYPSLERHEQTHRWRGLYAPVRCEACQRDLSNEYSVQRHIRRSQPTSRCRRMRVYSVMRSRTEIETTLRFHPKRAHGKKTVPIDLDYARAKYFSTPMNQ